MVVVVARIHVFCSTFCVPVFTSPFGALFIYVRATVFNKCFLQGEGVVGGDKVAVRSLGAMLDGESDDEQADLQAKSRTRISRQASGGLGADVKRMTVSC